MITEEEIGSGLNRLEALWGQCYKRRKEANDTIMEYCERVNLDLTRWTKIIEEMISENKGQPYLPKAHFILEKISQFEDQDITWETWKKIKSCGRCIDGMRVYFDFANGRFPSLAWCDCEKAKKHPQYNKLPILTKEQLTENQMIKIGDYCECWLLEEAESSLAEVPF